jgi:hypothetical protein
MITKWAAENDNKCENESEEMIAIAIRHTGFPHPEPPPAWAPAEALVPNPIPHQAEMYLKQCGYERDLGQHRLWLVPNDDYSIDEHRDHGRHSAVLDTISISFRCTRELVDAVRAVTATRADLTSSDTA